MNQDVQNLVNHLRSRDRLFGPVVGKVADLIEAYEQKQIEFVAVVRLWSEHCGLDVCLDCAGPLINNEEGSPYCGACHTKAVDQLARDLEEAAESHPMLIGDGHGQYWSKCSEECDMQIVRPGKAQCSCGLKLESLTAPRGESGHPVVNQDEDRGGVEDHTAAAPREGDA